MSETLPATCWITDIEHIYVYFLWRFAYISVYASRDYVINSSMTVLVTTISVKVTQDCLFRLLACNKFQWSITWCSSMLPKCDSASREQWKYTLKSKSHEKRQQPSECMLVLFVRTHKGILTSCNVQVSKNQVLYYTMWLAIIIICGPICKNPT